MCVRCVRMIETSINGFMRISNMLFNLISKLDISNNKNCFI